VKVSLSSCGYRVELPTHPFSLLRSLQSLSESTLVFFPLPPPLIRRIFSLSEACYLCRLIDREDLLYRSIQDSSQSHRSVQRRFVTYFHSLLCKSHQFVSDYSSPLRINVVLVMLPNLHRLIFLSLPHSQTQSKSFSLLIQRNPSPSSFLSSGPFPEVSDNFFPDKIPREFTSLALEFPTKLLLFSWSCPRARGLPSTCTLIKLSFFLHSLSLRDFSPFPPRHPTSHSIFPSPSSLLRGNCSFSN